jgi:hypothetical protein
MRRLRVTAAVLAAGFAANGCGMVPDLPYDIALPVQEILLHTACELNDAFRSLNTVEFARFQAGRWLIAVTLTPRVDTEITPGIGFTRKVPTPANALRSTSWVIGSAPGMTLDVKGDRNGAVTYNIKSQALISSNDLDCDRTAASYHVLAQHLGIGEWLHRTVSAMNVASMASLDKPTFNSEITIKFTGAGSYTYTFPQSVDLASLSGSVSVDEQLQISMAQIPATPKPYTVVTLPSGDNFGHPQHAPVGNTSEVEAVETAKQRLDLLQIEQAIKNLQPAQQ